jgi:hypothetical protein
MAARPVYSITRRSASEPDRPNAHTLRGLAAGAPHCRGYAVRDRTGYCTVLHIVLVGCIVQQELLQGTGV